MRIAINYFSAANRGGIGVYTRSLVKALLEIDKTNEYHLLCRMGADHAPCGADRAPRGGEVYPQAAGRPRCARRPGGVVEGTRVLLIYAAKRVARARSRVR